MRLTHLKAIALLTTSSLADGGKSMWRHSVGVIAHPSPSPVTSMKIAVGVKARSWLALAHSTAKRRPNASKPFSTIDRIGAASARTRGIGTPCASVTAATRPLVSKLTSIHRCFRSFSIRYMREAGRVERGRQTILAASLGPSCIT